MSDPVLVLGARIGPMLRSRVARAEELVADLVDAGGDPMVVVSGRGEAEWMRDWLVGRGMSNARIVVEPEAGSTNENLEKAQALLPETTHWLVVTSDFHAERTRLWARHLGIDITVIDAETPATARLMARLRERGALPHSWLRVAWRKFRR